jgi:hypothetical protein
MFEDFKCGSTVIGRPHIFDSVALTTLSFGLLALHIAAFCSGDNDVTFT